jgi:uncharacterized protein (TIGR02271 family)
MTSLPTTPSPFEAGQTDSSAVEVIRSEERLSAATTRHVTSRIRVGKRVVTEQRTITVNVSREEFYLEELPLDAAYPADSGLAGADRDVVIVLREEEPVVTTRLVPVEEVRVRVVRVTEEAVSTAEVAREVVEVDQT